MKLPTTKIPDFNCANAPSQRRKSDVATGVALVLAAACAPAVMAQSAPSQPAAAPAASTTSPAIQAGPVKLTFGGFTELAVIYRNKNQTADVGSSFTTGIPYPTTLSGTTGEFRESARQSRITMLAQGAPYDGASAEAYFEMDFLGAAPTANSNQSNSYNLRMRNIYGKFETASGFYILGGQNWSFATLEKKGMQPRDENVPLTIDASYVPGFNWTRNSQLRAVQKISDMISVGLSLESPQAIANASNNAPANVTGGVYPPNSYFNNTGVGGGLLNNGNAYTIDIAPDVIAKVAVDPGYGHYELYAMGREFRAVGAAVEKTTTGAGIGAGLILPLVPNVLSFQVSGLAGKGVGRYGDVQLPDVTVKPDGTFSTMKQYSLLFGLLYSPTPTLQTYLYAGKEQTDANVFTRVVGANTYGYGYGSPLYSNAGCETLGGTCTANTRQVEQVTAGYWWKFYRGVLGNAQWGMQLSYTERKIFAGVGGEPSANAFMGFASFRYYPYQK